MVFLASLPLLTPFLLSGMTFCVSSLGYWLFLLPQTSPSQRLTLQGWAKWPLYTEIIFSVSSTQARGTSVAGTVFLLIVQTLIHSIVLGTCAWAFSKIHAWLKELQDRGHHFWPERNQKMCLEQCHLAWKDGLACHSAMARRSIPDRAGGINKDLEE